MSEVCYYVFPLLYCKLGFGKTVLKGTRTEIHFIPTLEGYIHELSRNTKYLVMELKARYAFTDGFLTALSNHEDILRAYCYPYRTPWDARQLVIAVLAYPVDGLCLSMPHPHTVVLE